MGNCLPLPETSNKVEDLPVQTAFKFPSPIPTWPSGGEFAKGIINLGELEVCQVNTFIEVWATQEGGQDSLGATFFRPSPIPSGFFMLGGYCQPNNKALFGWVLVGKDESNGSSDQSKALEKPVDYTLLWSSESMKNSTDGHGYIWLPMAPEGYVAVGLTVTNSSEKPSLDEIRCVRSDLTEACENDAWLWGANATSSSSNFNVYSARPANRGTQALGVCVGTFTVEGDASTPSIACLKNQSSNSAAMPDLTQIHALVKAYSPWVYFHPYETYLPSSVSWYFDNGALLYKQSEPEVPTPIDSTGSNLPLGGSSDGAYWLDLPAGESSKEYVKKGNLQSSKCYIHVKPMLGATFTDIAIWLFYPFNGPAKAKVGNLSVDLGKIGEHVVDWEHVTLRISNFNGVLWRVYLSEHSSGQWVDASELEFEGGDNRPVAYSSLHGHALYPKAGLVLQGLSQLGIGIRNDTEKGKDRMETGAAFELVAADHLGSVVGPPWLDYAREWGPKITYEYAVELHKAVESLPDKGFKSALESLADLIPSELFEEEGPTGPKMKSSWSGDEK